MPDDTTPPSAPSAESLGIYAEFLERIAHAECRDIHACGHAWHGARLTIAESDALLYLAARLSSTSAEDRSDTDKPKCWRCKVRPGLVFDGTSHECIECAGETKRRTREIFGEIDEAVREGLAMWPRIADRVEFVRECIKLQREEGNLMILKNRALWELIDAYADAYEQRDYQRMAPLSQQIDKLALCSAEDRSDTEDTRLVNWLEKRGYVEATDSGAEDPNRFEFHGAFQNFRSALRKHIDRCAARTASPREHHE